MFLFRVLYRPVIVVFARFFTYGSFIRRSASCFCDHANTIATALPILPPLTWCMYCTMRTGSAPRGRGNSTSCFACRNSMSFSFIFCRAFMNPSLCASPMFVNNPIVGLDDPFQVFHFTRLRYTRFKKWQAAVVFIH